jgi:hypothetical protein
MYNKEKKYKTVFDFYTFENQQKQTKKVDNQQTNFYFEKYQEVPSFNKKLDVKIEVNKESNKTGDENVEENTKEHEKPFLELKWESIDSSITSPQVWGPSQWFTYHNAANNYPDNPSPLTKEKMKNIIIGIPVLLPCVKCKEHATAYIESRLKELDTIVSSKTNLFNFFVDFHNQVNKRYNKKIFTYEEAKELYNKKVKINRLTYS